MSRGGEKTERPTEKRLRESRRKGQVARSQDLTSAVLLLAACAVLALAGRQTAAVLSEAMSQGILRAATSSGPFDQAAALGAIFSAIYTLALALAPLLLVLMTISLLASYLQVGPLLAFDVLKPDPGKLNPATGLQQRFLKPRAYLELVKTVAKMAVAALVIGLVLWGSRAEVIALTHQPVLHAALLTSALALEILWKVGITFLALGVADYGLQRFLHLKELRMTKQEVKEELKETEGNPIYKQVRRQRHREILAQSLAAAVRGADAVVVNPTHVAVALKYDQATMSAPAVVAKGAELMAAQIRRLAQEGEVPILRDVPLARTLYELEVDEEIPEELYEATAVVLRWVYQLAQERGGEVTRHG
ncbi:MAG TPA: EscU/YscU/HrcU family type III secretion system export apparatus switch protein [Blastocatellia bacterium]|nr:EscU/YscU/HrcU family type III secretion system export apparatus switch protein [Blastocatellia bacterium]